MKDRVLGCCFLLLVVSATPALAQEDGPDTRLYDTGAPLASGLNPDALAKRSGWRLVPEDSLPARFSGDAVVLNDKLAVRFEKKARGPEVFSRTTGRLLASVGFLPTGSAAGEALSEFKVVENTAAAVKIQVGFGESLLRCRLTTGESILEIQPAQDAGSVAVQSETRYVVVPDYFGDDMVYGGPEFSGILPAENFCLNLLGSGEAMLMTVWQTKEQEGSLATVGGACLTQITCSKDRNIWLAFLEGAGIWHAEPRLPAGDWKPPFSAKWRCSFVRARNMADSWDSEPGPGPDQKAGEHQGPLLTYLIDRTPATPLTASCPTDVMRNTLGLGPCQYILACEGMGAQGDPTPNSVMGWVEKQFQQKKQRKAADEINDRLEFMAKHVEEAHAKIRHYGDAAAKLGQILAPSTAPGSLQSLAQDLVRFATAGLTPDAAPERCRQLAGQVKALLTQADALSACVRLGEQLRSIGSIQDRALARCRMTVRRLKQEARALSARPAANAGLTQQVQRFAEELLQGK